MRLELNWLSGEFQALADSFLLAVLGIEFYKLYDNFEGALSDQCPQTIGIHFAIVFKSLFNSIC